MSAIWFDSNALEITTAEHCTWWSFVSCLSASACGTVLENFDHNKANTSQIYKSWSLHYSSSTRTWTGACITQNQKDWESFKLNHKHSHSPQVQVGLQQHLSLLKDLSLLCTKNNNQCCSCGLTSFRPTEVTSTPSRKIRNTQLRFVFLNFSFVRQNNLRWSNSKDHSCNIGLLL